MGSVNFEVTGGRGERFLNDCVNAGVPVEHIRPTQTGYLATVPLRDYKRMHKYARRNRCRLRVREKYGAYFALFTYRHRWGILAGLVLCVLLLCMCRNLIWNICFYNFTPEQEASARAQLFEKGIYEGAFQNNERLVRAAGELFVGSEEYGWVALNFVQGRLVVEKHSGRCRSSRHGGHQRSGKERRHHTAAGAVDGYPRVVPGHMCRAGACQRYDAEPV
ncbi:MAG: sporulation protein YqfD [Ruthenibacterium lactatiformans]